MTARARLRTRKELTAPRMADASVRAALERGARTCRWTVSSATADARAPRRRPARAPPRADLQRQDAGTFLVDGRVAGTWRPDGTLEYFDDVQRDAVDAEARRLIEFIS